MCLLRDVYVRTFLFHSSSQLRYSLSVASRYKHSESHIVTGNQRRRAISATSQTQTQSSTVPLIKPHPAQRGPMDSRMKKAREVARGKRRRVFGVSLLLDAIYGTLPAPFFVYNGQVAPSLMMKKVPGVLLVILSCAIVYCAARAADEIGGFSFMVSALIPIGVHWVLFFLHAMPNKTEKLFDLAGQIGVYTMTLYSFYIAREARLRPRQVVVTGLCLVWSFRLGYFLFMRFLERKADFRFVEARTKYGYHLFAWTSQGAWYVCACVLFDCYNAGLQGVYPRTSYTCAESS